MKTRTLSMFACLLLALAAACEDPTPRPTIFPEPFPMTAQEPMRDVDLIFVVDTSLSMRDKQAQLRANFPRLVDRLQAITGGLPNLHLGVITPDLGTGQQAIPGCTAEGEAGLFRKGLNDGCANPGHHYIVDVEPRGCDIRKVSIGPVTSCPSHDCTQANCERDAFDAGHQSPSEPAGLTLALDDQGCPRCRNYDGETLSQVFSCVADVGISGCGFEQPLEALHRALTTTAPHNAGFLRPDALFAVVFITDEDDCSVEDQALFEPVGNFESPLGMLTSFRCTEFGLTCDEPWTRIMPDGSMAYHGCRPRPEDDPGRLLFPVSRYVDLLSGLKNPRRVVAATVAGPVGDALVVALDHNQNPALEPSCIADGAAAQPAVRLEAFVNAFHPQIPDWAHVSLCLGDYSPALEGLGNKLAAVVGTQCLAAVPAGCPDPAAAFGQPALTGLPSDVASVCAPDCTVALVDEDGDATPVAPCPADHAGGHPPQVDETLPVEACWHVTWNAACAVPCPEGLTDDTCDPALNPWNYPSRGAELVVSRRQALSEGWRVAATCASYRLTESVCDDGVDDDADGRTDADDPDCR